VAEKIDPNQETVGMDGDRPLYAESILRIQGGRMVYLIGTVYMEMPLKPDIIREITREVRGRRRLMIPSSDHANVAMVATYTTTPNVCITRRCRLLGG
jgi:hypothetical protein